MIANPALTWEHLWFWVWSTPCKSRWCCLGPWVSTLPVAGSKLAVGHQQCGSNGEGPGISNWQQMQRWGKVMWSTLPLSPHAASKLTGLVLLLGFSDTSVLGSALRAHFPQLITELWSLCFQLLVCLKREKDEGCLAVESCGAFWGGGTGAAPTSAPPIWNLCRAVCVWCQFPFL